MENSIIITNRRLGYSDLAPITSVNFAAIEGIAESEARLKKNIEKIEKILSRRRWINSRWRRRW